MIVTINVPRNKLRPMLRCGFFISPAIKVTLFHASLLKIDPTIAAAIAPTAAIVVYASILPSTLSLDRLHALAQLFCQTSPLIIINPNKINPNKLRILVTVNVVWIAFPPWIPLELIYVSSTIIIMETICAGEIFKNPRSSNTRSSLTCGTI